MPTEVEGSGSIAGPHGGQADFTMDVNAPITAIRCLTGPTLPQPSQAEGRFSWRLISHLSLNYPSLVDGKGEHADFHSLRKTFGTMLTLAGELPRNVMELMRHSDMRLTAKTSNAF